jgi:hypothetical protein
LLTLPLPLPLCPLVDADPLPLAEWSLTLALPCAEQPAPVRTRTMNAPTKYTLDMAGPSGLGPEQFSCRRGSRSKFNVALGIEAQGFCVVR